MVLSPSVLLLLTTFLVCQIFIADADQYGRASTDRIVAPVAQYDGSPFQPSRYAGYYAQPSEVHAPGHNAPVYAVDPRSWGPPPPPPGPGVEIKKVTMVKFSETKSDIPPSTHYTSRKKTNPPSQPQLKPARKGVVAPKPFLPSVKRMPPDAKSIDPSVVHLYQYGSKLPKKTYNVNVGEIDPTKLGRSSKPSRSM